jgi:mannosyl-3-phosphoglycerate phosphatase
VLVIFTDLDGTLLEENGSLSEDARAAVGALSVRGIPVVPLTSKTRLELERWIAALDAGGTGAFENGAGILREGRTEVLPGARPTRDLRVALDALRRQTRLPLVTFEEIPDAELTRLTGLPPTEAALAREREFDLPFLAPAEASPALSSSVSLPPGIRLTRGGRFWHLSGLPDKADAARRLVELLRPSRTIGLGDAPNDATFLSVVDHPVLVPKKTGVDGRLRAALPRAAVAPAPGGAGWSAAVRALVADERIGG